MTPDRHDVYYLRKYRELAERDDNFHLPFRCSCGSIYHERLIPNFSTGSHDGSDTLFWCMEEDYSTRVGHKDIEKAKKVVLEYERREKADN